MHLNRSYVLISPCRDEAQYLRRTLDSVTSQSILPSQWVIVDDGSRDATPQILTEYAERFDFIKVMRREGQRQRRVGPGVVEAFYVGYEALSTSHYSYLCKLDMDVELPPNYFEQLIERMEANSRIGTCSGKPYFLEPATGNWCSEMMGDDISGGQTKFYRKACFEDIGGFVHEVFWDVIDCHRCRMRGWMACSWDDPKLRFLHLRPVGASQNGILTGRYRHGYGLYFMGASLPYALVSAIYRMALPPFVVGGCAIFWGYVASWLKQKPQYEDDEFRLFLHRFHWRCLLHGKAKTLSRLNEKQVAS